MLSIGFSSSKTFKTSQTGKRLEVFALSNHMLKRCTPGVLQLVAAQARGAAEEVRLHHDGVRPPRPARGRQHVGGHRGGQGAAAHEPVSRDFTDTGSPFLESDTLFLE